MYNSILILGAMDVETDLLIKSLDDSKEKNIAGFNFYEGNYKNKKLIIGRTNIGMENAASCITAALLNYTVDAVISQGTAGGHNPKIHQEDIVIGKKLFNASSFKSDQLKKDEGCNIGEWNFYSCGINDCDMHENPFIESNNILVESALKVPNKYGNVFSGIIASSNNWNCELDRINLLHKKMGSDCEEMESYAVTQICTRFNIPCVTIRIISNSEQHPAETYKREIGIHCQEFVLDFIDNI